MKTGIHRPSQICPAEYSHVCFYSLASTCDGWPIPSFNIDVVVRLQREHKFATTGPGKCTVCGASFIYGEIWCHEPTGEHIHVGWQCAHKYGLFADRTEFTSQRAVHVEQAIRREKRRAMRAQIKAQLLADPELRAALRVNHHITKDIRAKFIQWGEVTMGQRKLLLKLATEANAPQEEEPNWTAVPEGRQLVEGQVLSAKFQESAYGETYKMLVLVKTDAGAYKVWGTVPSSIEDQLFQLQREQQDRNGAALDVWSGEIAQLIESEGLTYEQAKDRLGPPAYEDSVVLRGMTVRFKATLKGKEPGFGFFSRPSNGEVL